MLWNSWSTYGCKQASRDPKLGYLEGLCRPLSIAGPATNGPFARDRAAPAVFTAR